MGQAQEFGFSNIYFCEEFIWLNGKSKMQSLISHGYRKNIKNCKQYLMEGERLRKKQGRIKIFFVIFVLWTSYLIWHTFVLSTE